MILWHKGSIIWLKYCYNELIPCRFIIKMLKVYKWLVEKVDCTNSIVDFFLYPRNEDIWVDTFREDDEKGIAPRNLYKSFGFIEDELIIVNDYPHQRFILNRKEGQLI